MAKARAVLQLELEAYEASALLDFLQRHNYEFGHPDLPGGDELQAIMEEIDRVIPEMSYTPPIEGGEDEDATARS